MELGLLQRDVAALIGVNNFTIMNWEKGHNQPMTRHMPGVISFLGYVPEAPPPTTHGERLKQRRRELGLSQKAAAKLLEVDVSRVARWELDGSTGDPEQRKRIASFIGVPEEDVNPANYILEP